MSEQTTPRGDDGHTVALPPTKEQAMAILQALADDCSDGDQAYAVLEAPPEVLAAALGGTYRTGRVGRGMRRKHVIEWPAEVDRG